MTDNQCYCVKNKSITNNQYYWVNKAKRAQQASEWTEKMSELHSDLIMQCVKETKIYDDNNGKSRYYKPYATEQMPAILLTDEDSVTAICNHTSDEKSAVLNFASYKYPGGMFLKGSRAQEECLCHESFLYNVLSNLEDIYYAPNRKNLCRAMYTNRALYSPNVHFYHHSKDVTCDVITCAAPNLSAAARYANIDAKTNSQSLYSRIQFVLDVAACNCVKTLILGAFGCGVFRQNPKEVATIFKQLLPKYPFKNIVFAIPDKSHDNYKAFEKIFNL